MTFEQASKIIGNQPRYAIVNMRRALGLLPWMNTQDDETRREAAKMVLRNWPRHSRLVQQRLDDRYNKVGYWSKS